MSPSVTVPLLVHQLNVSSFRRRCGALYDWRMGFPFQDSEFRRRVGNWDWQNRCSVGTIPCGPAHRSRDRKVVIFFTVCTAIIDGCISDGSNEAQNNYNCFAVNATRFRMVIHPQKHRTKSRLTYSVKPNWKRCCQVAWCAACAVRLVRRSISNRLSSI